MSDILKHSKIPLHDPATERPMVESVTLRRHGYYPASSVLRNERGDVLFLGLGQTLDEARQRLRRWYPSLPLMGVAS